ncbi:MAG TPA: hypothetical protein VK626_01695 [Nitrospiraceae bacterium]|nr:hypothetical protein [Nitrospiraceae bacterium]
MSTMTEVSPIIARVLPRPAFDNSHVSSFRLWFAANEQRLQDFYNALTPYVPGEPLDDYFRWTVMVHEVESMRTRLPHGEGNL